MKTIKRYANRKLYDTESSSYVTLEEIADMVRQGEEIRIIDKRSGRDLTSVTLAQIVFEEQKRSRRRLPLPALRNIIQGGGDLLQKISQPVQQFKEDTQTAMDRFLARPVERLDEGRTALRDFAVAFQRTVDELQHRVDERVKDAVDTLTHVPQLHHQINELNEKVERLEFEVSRLTRTVERLWDSHAGDQRTRARGFHGGNQPHDRSSGDSET